MLSKFNSINELENFLNSQQCTYPSIQEGINHLKKLALNIGDLAYTNLSDEPNTFVILESISIGDIKSSKLEDEIRIIACTYFDYILRDMKLDTFVLFPNEIIRVN